MSERERQEFRQKEGIGSRTDDPSSVRKDRDAERDLGLDKTKTSADQQDTRTGNFTVHGAEKMRPKEQELVQKVEDP